MRGKGCFSQQLNDELLYLSKMYCFKTGRFSSVGAQGRCGGLVGGSFRGGHLHGSSLMPRTPVLEQACGMGLVTEHRSATSGVSQDPTAGKLAGTNPKSTQALSDR